VVTAAAHRPGRLLAPHMLSFAAVMEVKPLR
jgi:hypothetical protein